MLQLRLNAHKRGESRITDGGRLYWKHTTFYMWERKAGRRDIRVHTFDLETWPDIVGLRASIGASWGKN